MITYRARGLRHWIVTIILTGVLLLLVAFVYQRAADAVITLDMTQAQQYTLSRETLDILAQVEQPMRITGFYSTDVLRVRELDASIVRLYESATDGLITGVFYNPNDEPVLAEQFQLQVDGELFISYMTANGEVDFSTVTRVVPENNQERNLTSAIVRLLEINKFSVAFDSTFSDVSPYDTTDRGFSGLFNGLSANGIAWSSLDLAGIAARGEDIPEEITAVVLTRMREQISPAAIGVIDRYLKGGGAMLIMADADFSEAPFLSEDDPFNDFLWENYGIRMLDAIAIDAVSNAGTELDLLSYATSDGSSITGRLNDVNNPDSRTLFRIARAIEIDPSPPVNNGMVIATSETSYGETNFEDLLRSNDYSYAVTEDVTGPLNVAAWANDETTGARILLVGDVDWSSNGLVSSPVGNSILFTDGIAWLTGFGEQLSFAPQGRTTNLPTIFLSTQQLDLIALITVILMPGGALLLGLGIWWVRNRQ